MNGNAAAQRGLLVANVEVSDAPGCDVRCRDGRIVELGRGLRAGREVRLDGAGGALLPGLNDHHIHLFALAAAARSVRCGPPQVMHREGLRRALEGAPGDGWIRGIGYHESVAGMLDKRSLDVLATGRPVRMQHRSGKMWFLNSEALRLLRLDSEDGRLFRQDRMLRDRLMTLGDVAADVEAASRRLAAYGVTGLTDTTHTNDRNTVAAYRRLRLSQHVNLMGDDSVHAGALKIMLDEAALPSLAELVRRMTSAHRRERPVAVHCVTRAELVFALGALCEAGSRAGDRIEHASVVDAGTLALLAGMDVAPTVVTQPNFIAERGDQYLADVAEGEIDQLYRCRAFLDAGVPLGGGTDAPFGDPDPWRAMRAATDRKTHAGRLIGAAEALTPEQALALFTTPLDEPGGEPRRVAVGARADLCLLRRPWREARQSLSANDVAATFKSGAPTHVGPGIALSTA